MELHPTTKTSLSTVRLTTYDSQDQALSYGTGYFYAFEIPDSDETETLVIPVIVTNVHVIKGAERVAAVVTTIKHGANVGLDGQAYEQVHEEVSFNNLDVTIIKHPSNLDLCVILIGQMMNNIAEGFGLKSNFLNKAWRLSEEDKKIIRTIEPIAMIGYPNGLWDEVHNSPIARRGQTATHALTKWNGRREFVIDAACFPGSSGSPVFLYEDGLYRSSGDSFTPGTNVKLIGTLYAGPMISAEGKIVPKAIPSIFSTQIVPVALTELTMNLGFVIHADALDDFVPVIRERLAKL